MYTLRCRKYKLQSNKKKEFKNRLFSNYLEKRNQIRKSMCRYSEMIKSVQRSQSKIVYGTENPI